MYSVLHFRVNCDPAQNKTKEEALRQMRLMWFAFLMTIPLYIYGVAIGGLSWLHIRNAGTIFGVLGVLDLFYFAWIRMTRYSRALEAAQEHAEDMRTVRRWTVFWTVLVAIAESEALFGVCLQAAKDALRPAVPFYAVAFVLLLSLWPRQIWSSGITATRP